MNKIKKYIFISLLSVLAVSSVFMTVTVATSGAEVSKLQKEEVALSDQKRLLKGALVRTLSTNQLQEKGAGLGYEKPVNIVYVAPPEAVAKLP